VIALSRPPSRDGSPGVSRVPPMRWPGLFIMVEVIIFAPTPRSPRASAMWNLARLLY
jgi:hypothetical protein